MYCPTVLEDKSIYSCSEQSWSKRRAFAVKRVITGHIFKRSFPEVIQFHTKSARNSCWKNEYEGFKEEFKPSRPHTLPNAA